MLWCVNPDEDNHQLESRVRENRTHGSEGGEARAFPTPIVTLALCLMCCTSKLYGNRTEVPAFAGMTLRISEFVLNEVPAFAGMTVLVGVGPKATLGPSHDVSDDHR